jgi:hypothetical protein
MKKTVILLTIALLTCVLLFASASAASADARATRLEELMTEEFISIPATPDKMRGSAIITTTSIPTDWVEYKRTVDEHGAMTITVTEGPKGFLQTAIDSPFGVAIRPLGRLVNSVLPSCSWSV